MEQLGFPLLIELSVIDNVKNYNYQQIDAIFLANLMEASQV